MSSIEQIRKFISQKNLAIVGVSRTGKKFGNSIYTELKEKGYNVIPVNPHTDKINNDKCYPSISAIDKKIDGVVIVVPPGESIKTVKEAHNAGINSIWLQQGTQSTQAIEYCRDNNMDVIANECILMFTEPVKSMHSFHRWFVKLFGKYPK